MGGDVRSTFCKAWGEMLGVPSVRHGGRCWEYLLYCLGEDVRSTFCKAWEEMLGVPSVRHGGRC